MFGFFPEDGEGDCALTDALKTDINVRMKTAKMSFVFMVVRIVEVAFPTIRKPGACAYRTLVLFADKEVREGSGIEWADSPVQRAV